jgi:hypothetical protein
MSTSRETDTYTYAHKEREGDRVNTEKMRQRKGEILILVFKAIMNR